MAPLSNLNPKLNFHQLLSSKLKKFIIFGLHHVNYPDILENYNNFPLHVNERNPCQKKKMLPFSSADIFRNHITEYSYLVP